MTITLRSAAASGLCQVSGDFEGPISPKPTRFKKATLFHRSPVDKCCGRVLNAFYVNKALNFRQTQKPDSKKMPLESGLFPVTRDSEGGVHFKVIKQRRKNGGFWSLTGGYTLVCSMFAFAEEMFATKLPQDTKINGSSCFGRL